MQRICLDCAGVKDSLASVLQITPDGDRLYAGVRGLNQIKEFIVEPEGTLREARLFTSCGWPRSFLYREENALLIVNEEYGDSKGALELWDLKTGHRSGYRAFTVQCRFIELYSHSLFAHDFAGYRAYIGRMEEI